MPDDTIDQEALFKRGGETKSYHEKTRTTKEWETAVQTPNYIQMWERAGKATIYNTSSEEQQQEPCRPTHQHRGGDRTLRKKSTTTQGTTKQKRQGDHPEEETVRLHEEQPSAREEDARTTQS